MLYSATEFEQSTREVNDIYKDALAIYRVTYDSAQSAQDAGKCYFAWQVAGTALCKFHTRKET